MTHKLVKELNYNPKQIYKLNIADFLNWLAYFKEKEKYEEKLRDKQKGITRY